MRSLIALFVVLSFSSLYLGKCLSETPALYVLGDSLVDSGNNNWLDVPLYAKANYLPYGKDFPDGATGRVTNGRNVPDFIAEYLRLPYPTRVMDPDQPPVSLTGYNYASAGCGILSETGPSNVLDLAAQVSLFEKTKEEKLRPAFDDQTQLDNHLANSIFFIWIGNNDYLLNYFNASSNSSQNYTPEEFASLLTERLSEKLEELYNLGARKIVVFEGAPYGCLPYSVNSNGVCNETRNDIAILYNNKIDDMVDQLSSKLSNSYFTVGKAYDLTLDAINNPAKYGLINVSSPCCRVLKPLVQCIWLGGSCTNRTQYAFWDRAHPTEAAYSVLGGQCITNSSVCTPFSIKDLAEVNVVNPISLLSTDKDYQA